MRRYVWSRNLKNEDAMARVGPQSHMGGRGELWKAARQYFALQNRRVRAKGFLRNVWTI